MRQNVDDQAVEETILYLVMIPSVFNTDPRTKKLLCAAAKQLRALLDYRNILQRILLECADDLEAEINDRYKGTLNYPERKKKYDQDMEVVLRSRKALKRRERDGDWLEDIIE